MRSDWKVRRRWPKRSPAFKLPLPVDCQCAQHVVLDTNVLLDLWLYEAPCDSAIPLHDALLNNSVQWLATEAMRAELERVLAYPHIAARLAGGAERFLGRFDAHARLLPAAARAPVHCRDVDDQKFLDLAAAHPGAQLISHDKEVLACAHRMARLVGVAVGETFPARLPRWQ